MLTSIQVKNFKSIQDSGEIAFKPITLFIGANSSGKSSILQTLLMLKQTLESREKQPLVIEGDYVRLGTFEDFIYGRDINRELEIEIELRFSSKKVMKLKLGFKYNPESRLIEQTQYVFTDSEGVPILRVNPVSKILEVSSAFVKEHSLSDKKYIKSIENNSKFSEVIDSAVRQKRNNFIYDYEYDWDWHVANSLSIKDSPSSIMSFFEDVRPEMPVALLYFYYLKPVRAALQRDYKAAGERPYDVGLYGENAVQFLFQDQYAPTKQHLKEKVSKWFKQFEFGYEPEIEELGGNNYRFQIKDAKTGIKVNVSDLGFGVSQLLPVIVQGFAATDGLMFIIEQPEIHLHPKAQSELGDLMIDIAGIKKGERSELPKTLLIETHSEHLITRLQRRIAEGIISHDDVAIYFVEATNEGSKFALIKMDEYGRFENWPAGFFAEDADEMFAFQQAVFDKLKADKKKQQSSSEPQPVK
jgi:predicted ATPase